MNHAKNKVEWCLKKAEKELKAGDIHRGLIKVTPDIERAREHIKKSDHYLSATLYLKKGNFSDISASTIFYAIYHCLLAIAIKFGYESRNQESTFALINSLIEDKKINFDKELLSAPRLSPKRKPYAKVLYQNLSFYLQLDYLLKQMWILDFLIHTQIL